MKREGGIVELQYIYACFLRMFDGVYRLGEYVAKIGGWWVICEDHRNKPNEYHDNDQS